MKLSTFGFATLCATIVLVSSTVLVLVNQNRKGGGQSQNYKEDSSKQTLAEGTPRNPPKENWKMIGGVYRPPSDFAKDSVPTRTAQQPRPVSRIGESPKLSAEENANTRSVVEAVKTQRFPERLSSMIEPPPFDRKTFEKNPENYINTVEPGRVFQVLARGGDVKPIGEIGSQYFELIQGESAVLKAKADPGVPVTFYSPRLGQFENGLTAQTVVADKEGIAAVNFKASPGTYGDIDVIAGSPTRSGNARFLVKVVLPK